MILKASQRGGDAALAAHLLNTNDNDHVEVHAINGFISNDVAGAFQEIKAVAQATKCKQYMFSLSLSPPKDAMVSNEEFMDAIDQSMKRTGLSGQPHVIIFHEKHGRRHAHLVVSRIDIHTMKAINLSFFKERLCDLSRELYLSHDWELPQGHVDRKLADPLSYSLEEYQVAKRAKRDRQEIKSLLQVCWTQSDSKASFEAALLQSNFRLCRGNKRGFVAIDANGKVYSLSRWLNVKTKELKARLGEPVDLQSTEQALRSFENKNEGEQRSHNFDKENKSNDPIVDFLDAQISTLDSRKGRLIIEHKLARLELKKQHIEQRIEEMKHFKSSNSPLHRLWRWTTGNRHQVLAERIEQISALKARQDNEALDIGHVQRIELKAIRSEVAELKRQRHAIVPLYEQKTIKPEFLAKSDPDRLFHKAQIAKTPDYVLKLISDKKSVFSKNDISKKLEDYICVPSNLRDALEKVLNSPELITVADQTNKNPSFTTRTYQKTHNELIATVTNMAEQKCYGVSRQHLNAAIAKQNKALKKFAGASLSNEQCEAIEHVLNRRQLSNVVGLAGAGKSTMLSAANDAWTSQGYRVLGAALSGKAADGLQQASSIPSKTLASWEIGWKHGRNLLNVGDVFVIDEVGMVGTAQLSRIMNEVQKQRAKLVLVGDPEQLQPIQAGTPFRDILQQTSFAKLTEIRRQKLDWQVKASSSLAKGKIAEAMQAYDDHGCVEYSQSSSDSIASLVEDYMVDLELHGDSKSRIALAHRRVDVFGINQGIRAARKSAHELDNEQVFETDHGKRAFAVGDRIVFTRNNKSLGVKNGMLGRVIKTHKQYLTIILDSSINGDLSDTLIINSDSYSSFDHGYATTIHKSQGATADHAFVLSSKNMDDHLRYVAMTRHRNNLKIYQQNEQELQFDVKSNLKKIIHQDYEFELS